MNIDNSIAVSFNTQSMTDIIIKIGTSSFAPGTTISSLPLSNPQYWIDVDINGVQHLCTNQVIGMPLTGTFMGVSGPYSVLPTPFILVSDHYGLNGGNAWFPSAS